MLNIDCQKLIVNYTDPIIYRYCFELDPKNYNKKGLYKMISECSEISAIEIIQKYNDKVEELHSNTEDKNLRRLENMKILETLKNWNLIQIRSNRNNTLFFDVEIKFIEPIENYAQMSTINSEYLNKWGIVYRNVGISTSKLEFIIKDAIVLNISNTNQLLNLL
jgi:hypothetical protein